MSTTLVCKLCQGKLVIMLKCLMCQGPHRNRVRRYKCDRCVEGSGYIRTNKCDSYCNEADWNEIKKANMGTSIERVWCHVCGSDMKECPKCAGMGLMCHLCSNTGKMEQWCPACILNGNMEVIKD